MSKTYTYDGEKTWNYLGRFYGIDPGVLAAFNGHADAKLSSPIEKGTKLTIPDAGALTKFYPEYRKIFLTSTGDTRLNLPAPTLVHVKRELVRYNKTEGQGEKLGLAEPLIQNDGNMVVVNAARMRRFGHTGDNYQNGQPLRSGNPKHEGNSMGPDARPMGFAEEWWKCNVLVGDTMYAAGFDWPMSEFNRYLQPKNLMQEVTYKGNPYADPIYVSPEFKNGKPIDDKVALTPPTLSQVKDVKPGDVMILHAYNGGTPGHSAIITSHPQLNEKGELAVRVVDIYGETWITLNQHGVAAVVRPKKKLMAPAEQAVYGDPNKADKYIDDTAAQREYAPITDADVGEDLWRTAD